MSYSLDAAQDDCYENSTVLINKFNIRDDKQLAVMEQGLTSIQITKALTEIPFENVDFEFYKMLHKFVFDDIYEWAGKVRVVDLSKQCTVFCLADKIDERAKALFNRLKQNNYLKDFVGDEFISEFTDLYCALNYLHPFIDGNGRIQRLFLSMLVSDMGKILDFSEIDTDLLMVATIKSVSGDIFLLKDIFNTHIK